MEVLRKGGICAIGSDVCQLRYLVLQNDGNTAL